MVLRIMVPHVPAIGSGGVPPTILMSGKTTQARRSQPGTNAPNCCLSSISSVSGIF